MWTPEPQRGVKSAGPCPSAKADATVTALAIQFAPEAVAVLEELMTHPHTDPGTALLAAEVILNVSVGRPPSRTIEVVPELSPEKAQECQAFLRALLDKMNNWARTRGQRTEEVEHLEALVVAAESARPEFT